MITTSSESIFDIDAEALINPVNCIGVSGAGLAKTFRERYPKNFYQYNMVCGQGKLKIGQLFVTRPDAESRRFIVNFPTKVHWKDRSHLFSIHRGLLALLRWAKREHIQSIAMPKLGCGLGKLAWPEVRALIVQVFGPVAGINVILLER